MTCEVVLTKDAERDLEDIYRYIAEHDSPVNADRVLDRLLQVTEALRTLPDRGYCPNELRSLGISEYRQVLFNAARVAASPESHSEQRHQAPCGPVTQVPASFSSPASS
jgi:toxin ParE1/3/4